MNRRFLPFHLGFISLLQARPCLYLGNPSRDKFFLHFATGIRSYQLEGINAMFQMVAMEEQLTNLFFKNRGIPFFPFASLAWLPGGIALGRHKRVCPHKKSCPIKTEVTDNSYGSLHTQLSLFKPSIMKIYRASPVTLHPTPSCIKRTPPPSCLRNSGRNLLKLKIFQFEK